MKAIHSTQKLEAPKRVSSQFPAQHSHNLQREGAGTCAAAAGGAAAAAAAGAMAMAVQSPLHLDSLSNGFMGMGLNTNRPASQASPKANTSIRMAIKRWERKEVKENSLPVVKKLHIKIGDTVKVIAGHDKGKISTVTQLYTHNSKVVLKDVNLKTKHVKGKAEGETGQIVQVEAPIHSSNVMLYSKTAKVASRVGHKTLEDGKRVRFLVKTGEVIDSAEEWKKVHKKKDEKKE